RLVLGYQIRVVGLAPHAARHGGFSANGTVWMAMLISGGLAGFAGILEAMGPVGRLILQFPSNYGFTAIIVAFLALTEWRSVARRLALDLPLAVLAVVYAFAGHGPHLHLLGLTLSRPGLQVGLAILAKATIGVIAVSALAACTTVPEIIDGLRKVGAPAWFRQLIALSARQLQVLRADLTRLRMAVHVRTATDQRRLALATGARSLGSLFVRTAERADRLHVAAELRGAVGAAATLPATADDPPADPSVDQSVASLPAGTAARRITNWIAAFAPCAVAVVASVLLR
ncbi:MAG TPA: CbiQ family ECF transporter T component, partial [Acidimicrobiales bacterium]